MTVPDLVLRARRAVRRRRPVGRREVAAFASAMRTPERLTALRSVVDGLVVFTILRRRGLRPLLSGRSEFPPVDPALARRTAAAVDAGLGLLPVAPTCLRRSVTLLRELDRRELGASLHIGVRSSQGRVEAHAWVQSGGTIVNDSADVVGTYSRIAAGEAGRLLPAFS